MMRIVLAICAAFLPSLLAFQAPVHVDRAVSVVSSPTVGGRLPVVAKPALKPGHVAPRMLVDESMQIASTANLAISAAQEIAVPSLLVGTGYYLVAAEGEEGEEEESAEDGEVDIYRDTLLRYLGYSNELGEAFRPITPAFVVPASYAVAIAYVLADTVDKAKKAIDSGKYSQNIGVCGAIEGVNAFIWQILASVALPGFTIHQMVGLTELIESQTGFDQTGGAIAEYLPTAVGLITIPFIVAPLDELAEKIMDLTLRKLSANFLKECELPENY